MENDEFSENNAKALTDELSDTKMKLKIMTTKFNNVKKERDNFSK